MKSENPKCVLARDKDGAFYEIPVDKAKEYALPLKDVAKAIEFYSEDTTDQEELLWRKMTGWGTVA